MDDGGPTASIILFFILLFTDIFFYGFGSALQELGNKDIERKTEEEKDKKAERLKAIIANPASYVDTLQLTVTLIHLIMGGFYLKLIQNFLSNQAVNNLHLSKWLGEPILQVVVLIAAMFVLMYVLLTFGILMPKKLAAKYPEKWVYACINPVYYITRLLKPLTGLISISAKGFLRLFGVKVNSDISDVTEEEIISMVNEGHEQGVFQASEAEMITNIFELDEKQAKDIMTPRKNMIVIDGRTSLKEAIQFMLDECNSRYPIYEDNIDHIIGILYLKDALRMHAADESLNAPVGDIAGLIREAVFIPETRNIEPLFRSMQSGKIQMVIVIDEYGQTSGLVAMEDILEEIVGNILDEYDEDEEYIEEKGENEYIIEGMTPLEELEEHLNISFEEEEFDTLNGFLISKMDKIPEENEQFDIDVSGYNFKVLSVENKMIQSVLVTKLPESGVREHQSDDKDVK